MTLPCIPISCGAKNCSFDDVEGCWKAGQFRGLKTEAPYWQAAFHARLAGNFEALGYATERRGKYWDVACVSRPTVEKFSRRTEQIERIAKENGITSPEAKSRLGATTRKNKDKKATWDQLVEGWNDRMTEAGTPVFWQKPKRIPFCHEPNRQARNATR